MIPFLNWLAANTTPVRATREVLVTLPSGAVIRLFATEGALPLPTRLQVAALPCCQPGAPVRYSVDDAWAMIKAAANVASVSVDHGGQMRLGHPQHIYDPGAVASERRAAAERFVAQVNEMAVGVYLDVVSLLKGQGEVVARYAEAVSGQSFVQNSNSGALVTYANGAVASHRTAAATGYCLPDGWLVVHKTVVEEAGSPNVSRVSWLLWCGSGRGGYEINRFNTDDNSVPDWTWGRSVFTPTVGVNEPRADDQYPLLIPAAATSALWAANVRSLTRQQATGWGPSVTLDLYVHGCTTIPTGPVTIGATDPAPNWPVWLMWANRPDRIQEVPGDRAVAVTSYALSLYYRNTLARQDRQPGPTVTSGWLGSVDRLGVTGAMFLFQQNDQGRRVKRLQDVSAFSSLSGDDEILPANNVRPAYTVTRFNSTFQGSLSRRVMQSVQLGPKLEDIRALPHGGGAWGFAAGASYHVYPPTLSAAQRADLLALIGDEVVQVPRELRTVLRQWLTSQGLAILADQVHTEPQDQAAGATDWLMPSFLLASDDDFHTAYIGGGAELSEDTVSTIQALREGERVWARTYLAAVGAPDPWTTPTPGEST